jgi:MoaA/NifB/PqqE/SkfB family radical SAM enzyme
MAAPARSAADTIRSRFTSPFPAIVHVELTNECNLECPMCARTTSMTRPVQHMPAEMFMRIVDELQGKGVDRLLLHHFGESLLHPQAYELIKYASRKKGAGRVSLSTNVTTLNRANAKKLIKSHLHHLTLSVDAHSKDVYEVVRGFDFDRVIANAKGFLELHRERESKMHVTVMIINMGIKRGEIDAFERTWAPYASPRVKVLVKKMTNYGGAVDTTQFAGGEIDTDEYDPDRRRSCPKLWDSLTIQSNGQVVACGYDVNGTMPYGNVADMSLVEAWNGDPIRALREQHLKLNFDGLALCEGCNKTMKKRKRGAKDTLSATHT